MELDERLPTKLEPMHPEVVALENSRRLAPGRRGTAHHHRPTDQEHQPPTRPEQARRFRHPPVRIEPRARAILRDRKIKALVVERHVVCACADKREQPLKLPLEHPGAIELLIADVDPDRQRAPLRKPCTHMPRSTTELDRIHALPHPGQKPKPTLRRPPDPPHRLLQKPVVETDPIEIRRPRIPHLPIPLQISTMQPPRSRITTTTSIRTRRRRRRA